MGPVRSGRAKRSRAVNGLFAWPAAAKGSACGDWRDIGQQQWPGRAERWVPVLPAPELIVLLQYSRLAIQVITGWGGRPCPLFHRDAAISQRAPARSSRLRDLLAEAARHAVAGVRPGLPAGAPPAPGGPPPTRLAPALTGTPRVRPGLDGGRAGRTVPARRAASLQTKLQNLRPRSKRSFNKPSKLLQNFGARCGRDATGSDRCRPPGRPSWRPER